MLKKLLKYDLKAIFKLWWIGAISALALSVLGGAAIQILDSDYSLPGALSVLASVVLVIVIFGFMAFLILSLILIFVRFYKNFFSDEGYLTFTLPVTRFQLLNSKLITAVTTSFATNAVLAVSVLVMLMIGLGEEFFNNEFWAELGTVFSEMAKELGAYLPLYIIELIIIAVLISVLTQLFMFCCITLASTIVKKAKIPLAIGIYYGANSIISFVMQIVYLFCIPAISENLESLPEKLYSPLFALILLLIMLFVGIFCGLLYTLHYYMLDKKLNLS